MSEFYEKSQKLSGSIYYEHNVFILSLVTQPNNQSITVNSSDDFKTAMFLWQYCLRTGALFDYKENEIQAVSYQQLDIFRTEQIN